MDYIYDIVLNFQNHYYEFYEWHKDDKIINIQRIPIYKIKNKDYQTIKNNYVTITNQKILLHKLLLLTNGFEVMGILINKKGKVLKKSSLIIEESDDILKYHKKFKKSEINYIINNYDYSTNKTRIIIEQEKYIRNFFKSIDQEKDKYKLKYLYYDIYKIDEENIKKIYNNLLNLSKKDMSLLYNALIKFNLELSQKKTSN